MANKMIFAMVTEFLVWKALIRILTLQKLLLSQKSTCQHHLVNKAYQMLNMD